MAKDLNQSPAETGFNETDVLQIVEGMFDGNKTPKDAINVEGHGRVLEITFSNKNPDSSYKREKRVFATNEATDYATTIAIRMVSNARSSFGFDATPIYPSSKMAVVA